MLAAALFRPDDLLVLGSRRRVIAVEGTAVEVHPYYLKLAQSFGPNIVVHLASLTREHLSHTSTSDFVRRNRQLLKQGLQSSALDTVTSVLSVSSGTALRDSGPYGQAKRHHEFAFEQLNEGPRRTVLNARVWSVSGQHCTKPEVFALTSMIRAAKGRGIVRVKNPRLVWRRYVDAGEYLRLCQEAAKHGVNSTIESSGELVEMREFAERIGAQYGAVVRYEAAETGEPDAYYSNDDSMWSNASRLGHSFTSLAEQVTRTGEYL